MKTLKNMMAILLMAVSSIAFSQSATKLENVQVKLMKMDGKLYLFLTDQQNNPFSNKNITATGKATGAEITKPKLSLSPYGENAFVINSNPGDFDKLKLTFHLKNGESSEYVYATINNKHQDENAYVCSMHSGDISKAEGKCPKCGMGLEAKKVSVYNAANVVRKGSR
jgi:hypothetical protein